MCLDAAGCYSGKETFVRMGSAALPVAMMDKSTIRSRGAVIKCQNVWFLINCACRLVHSIEIGDKDGSRQTSRSHNKYAVCLGQKAVWEKAAECRWFRSSPSPLWADVLPLGIFVVWSVVSAKLFHRLTAITGGLCLTLTATVLCYSDGAA